MEKEKVIVCDECKRVLAEHKCKFCDKDLCKECFVINSFVGLETTDRASDDDFMVKCCHVCYKALQRIKLVNSKQYQEIKEEFCKYIKKILIVDAMEDEKKEEKPHINLIPSIWTKPITPIPYTIAPNSKPRIGKSYLGRKIGMTGRQYINKIKSSYRRGLKNR